MTSNKHLKLLFSMYKLYNKLNEFTMIYFMFYGKKLTNKKQRFLFIVKSLSIFLDIFHKSINYANY